MPSLALIGHTHDLFRLLDGCFDHLFTRDLKRDVQGNPDVSTAIEPSKGRRFYMLANFPKVACVSMEPHPYGGHPLREGVPNADVEAGFHIAVWGTDIAPTIDSGLAFVRFVVERLIPHRVDPIFFFMEASKSNFRPSASSRALSIYTSAFRCSDESERCLLIDSVITVKARELRAQTLMRLLNIYDLL